MRCNDTAAYAAALAYITGNIEDLRGWTPNLREACLGNDNLSYSDSGKDLSILPYPGDGKGFGEAEFCNLKAELQLEFDWLDATKTLFDTYEKALNRSGNQQQVDLHTIGENIRAAVAPPNANIVSPVLRLLQGIFGLAAGPLGPDVGAAVGVLASSYDLANAIASEKGVPVGARISTKVDDLASEVADNLSGTANALDRIRDVVISDYGRLQALGSVADGPGWAIDVPTMTTNLTTAADAYFYSELMPVAYYVWYLSPAAFNSSPTVDNCYIYFMGHSFRGAPATSQLRFDGDFDGRAEPAGVGSLWVLGTPTLSPSEYAYPPAALTDSMSLPTAQNGSGVQPPRFFWTRYKAPPTRTTYCH